MATAELPTPSGQRMTLPARLRWAAGAARLTLREPGDGLDRVMGRVRSLVRGGTVVRHRYEAEAGWEERLHGLMGAPWPCPEHAEFEAVWSQTSAELRQQGLATGRAAYGGWDDGDAGLARAVWCLCRHLHVSTVLETGVARGITSRVILEALQRNRGGTLYSIDLPALDPALHDEIGAAVPERLRAHWRYLEGTSRKRLPPLLAELGEIDLFVHDSSHTTRNVRFELENAWASLQRGAVLADDIERNDGFGDFLDARRKLPSLLARADDGVALFGIALKGLGEGEH